MLLKIHECVKFEDQEFKPFTKVAVYGQNELILSKNANPDDNRFGYVFGVYCDEESRYEINGLNGLYVVKNFKSLLLITWKTLVFIWKDWFKEMAGKLFK